MLLTRTIMAAVMIALLLALTLWLPPVWMAAVIAVLGFIGVYELMRTVGDTKNPRHFIWPGLTAAAIPLGFYFGCAELISRVSLTFLMVILFAEAIFTYGTEKRTQYIRLLRPAIDPAAMEKICERFRYETGITPTLLS